ncbi:glutamate--tRNA ligase, partial [Anaerofustis stercorihominis]|uniref:glutamate--tRNA ligase n=1 Tax=Anaerofustis stercorihominis TaxID=214853 RepID=UPI0026737B76
GKCKNRSREEAEEKIKNGESYVIRMALPEDEDITFEDEVRGKVTINTKDVDEQVLIKTDGFPTYHFAVVVDDHLMDVNYVIRGEEWLVSTPKHIILYNYLGWEPPKFAHLPTVLNKNKKKLSKRHDSVAVEDFIQKGYLPEALINYIALLGWSDPNDREILSMEELIKDFDISRVTKAGAVFDTEKLNWVNAHYIKEKSNEELIALIKPYLLNEKLIDDSTSEEILIYIVEAIKDKLNYFEESIELTKELFLKADLNALDDNAKEIMDMETNETLFSNLVSLFEKEDSLTPEIVGKSLKSIQKEFKIKGKALYMPTRIAISGIMHGADLTYILSILGKDEVISRLKTAIEFIK